MNHDRPQATDAECTQLLRTLLDDRAQMMAKLAPQGWLDSPLRQIFHPTAGQQYEQSLRVTANLNSLFGKKEQEPQKPPPRPEDFTEDPPDAGNPDDEFTELLGDCLWLIFSNNHTVFDGDGRAFDLGSFRGSGGFIADFLNEFHPLSEGSFDYIDFYCAGAFSFERANTTPVFQFLFERLKSLGCDWEYSFPRIGIVDFSGLKEDMDGGNDDPANYDPAKALENELEKSARQQETDRLRAQLDEAFEQAFEEAKYKAPPPEVQAYRNVFGRLPAGFPGAAD